MPGTDEQKREWLDLASKHKCQSIGQGGRCPVCDNVFGPDDPVREIYQGGPTFNTPAGMNWICTGPQCLPLQLPEDETDK